MLFLTKMMNYIKTKGFILAFILLPIIVYSQSDKKSKQLFIQAG